MDMNYFIADGQPFAVSGSVDAACFRMVRHVGPSSDVEVVSPDCGLHRLLVGLTAGLSIGKHVLFVDIPRRNVGDFVDSYMDLPRPGGAGFSRPMMVALTRAVRVLKENE